MALTNLSQVTSSGIHTLSNYTTHNINSTGIITATEFSGNLSNSSGISTFAEIRVTGNLTVEGTTTTLDSNLTEVDRIEVGANSASPGIAVTQSGTGAAATFEGGNVAIGHNNPSYMLHLKQYGNNEIVLNNTRGSSLGSLGQYDNHLEVNALSNHPLLLKTNSVERLRITSAGKVGIGSEIPNSKLEVWNNSNIEVLRLRDTHFNKYLTIRGGASPNRMVIDSYEGGGGGADIDLASNGSTKVRITSGGNVGIGTDNPTAKLDVDGTVNVSSNSTIDGNLTVGNSPFSASPGHLIRNVGQIVTRRDGTKAPVYSAYDGELYQTNIKIQFENDGSAFFMNNVGIGTDNPQTALEIGKGHTDPIIRLNDPANRRMSIRGPSANNFASVGTETSHALIFFTNGYSNERLRITSAGNIGINDQNPGDKLSISGGSLGIYNTGNNHGNVYFYKDGTPKGWLKYRGDNDTLLIGNVTDSIHVLSSGNVGISDATPENALTIKNIGSFEGDANSFYLGSNFTGTGQNFTGSGKHAQRFFFNNASSNGYLKYENTGTTGTAGNAITWQERFRITSAGDVGIGTAVPITSGGYANLSLAKTNGGQVEFKKLSNDRKHYIWGDDNLNIGASYNGGGGDLIVKVNGNNERLRIDNVGSAQFTGQDSPSGRNTRISRYGSLLVATTGELISNARCSIDSGNGNITTEGGVMAASVNLQSSSTSSWFQTGASYGGTNYVWAAKDSSANVWHSGLQTDGDLLIGGNITGTSRIGLYGSSGNIGMTNATTSAKLNVSTDISGNYTGWKERNVASGSMSSTSIASKTPTINDFTYPNSSNGMLIWSTSKIGFAAGGESPQYGTGVQMLFDSGGLMLGGNRAFDRTSSTSTTTNWTTKLNTNGSAVFRGSLEADPILLDANDSWVKSTYGGISNSTVSSLNNLMIGQNMRGWIGTRDGGSPTNNFYHVTTHNGLGYCGTEYCYEGITKFYNNTGGTTANATFTPKERVRLTSSRFYSSSGFHFSTNSSSNNSLPNPYAIGNVNSNNVAYPHTPGIYFVTASCQCDNTWRTLFTSINDSNWVIEGTSGDASSKRKYKIIGNPTSPSYGVNLMNTDYNDGGWNTGSISFRLDGTHPNWNLQVKCTSYYSTGNTSGIKFMLFVYY